MVACPKCEGYGTLLRIDEDFGDTNIPLLVYENCHFPWRGESMADTGMEFGKCGVNKFDIPIQ